MKKGFTLTEILISLIVIAVILAISMPVIMKSISRQNIVVNRPWTWVDNSGVFDNTCAGYTAAIGTASVPDTNTTKLVINTNSNNADAISFLNNDVKIGSLKVNSAGCSLGRDILLSSSTGNAVGIGNNVQSCTNSVVIGSGISGLNDNEVVIGSGTGAAGYNVIAIGTSANAYTDSIAIGTGAKAQAGNAIAIGVGANAYGDYSAAIGYNSSATNTSYVIGDNSNISANNSILIAHDASIPHDIDYIATYPGNVSIGADNKVILGTLSMPAIFVGSVYFVKNMYAHNLSAMSTHIVSHSQMSDLRLKNIESEYTQGMEKLNQLKYYNYAFKSDPKRKRVGVVAQELMKIFPDAVSKDENGYYMIRQEDIFYTMVNALKELNLKIKTVADDIKKLDKLTVSLNAKIKKLSKQTEKNTNDIEKLKKDINSIEVKLRNNN